jgi:hypothetical protein
MGDVDWQGTIDAYAGLIKKPVQTTPSAVCCLSSLFCCLLYDVCCLMCGSLLCEPSTPSLAKKHVHEPPYHPADTTSFVTQLTLSKLSAVIIQLLPAFLIFPALLRDSTYCL